MSLRPEWGPLRSKWCNKGLRINCQVKSDVQPEPDAKVTLSVLYLPVNVSQLYSSLSLVAAFIAWLKVETSLNWDPPTSHSLWPFCPSLTSLPCLRLSIVAASCFYVDALKGSGLLGVEKVEIWSKTKELKSYAKVKNIEDCHVNFAQKLSNILYVLKTHRLYHLFPGWWAVVVAGGSCCFYLDETGCKECTAPKPCFWLLADCHSHL